MTRRSEMFSNMVLIAMIMCFLGHVVLRPVKVEAREEKTLKAAPFSQKKWEEILAAAKKEGKVTVVTFVGSETRLALTKAFKAKYGIDLDFTVGQGAATLTKIQAERGAGLYTADAVINGTSVLTLFKTNGLLEPLASALMLPEVTDPKMWYGNKISFFDKEGTGLGFLSQYNSCVLRNTELVKEGEITSYNDLLKPQWKDKVIMYDPSISGSGAMFMATLSLSAWNVDEAGNWFRKMLREQNMTITRDPRLQVEWVARGKYPIALATYTDQMINFFVSGAPIMQHKVKEGGFVTSSTGALGLFNHAPHPNASIVFANWLLSKEGQIAFTSGFGGPSNRKDVKATGVYAALTPSEGDKAYDEDEEGMLKKNELTKTWGKIISEK